MTMHEFHPAIGKRKVFPTFVDIKFLILPHLIFDVMPAGQLILTA